MSRAQREVSSRTDMLPSPYVGSVLSIVCHPSGVDGPQALCVSTAAGAALAAVTAPEPVSSMTSPTPTTPNLVRANTFAS